MRLPITVVFCLPCLALSFSREKISLRRYSRSPAARVDISSQDLQDVLSDDLIPQQETELWLDLRKNVMHPKAAIEQLETEIGATSFVDRILLSESVFQNLVDSNDMYLTTSQILYQPSEGDDIFMSSSRGLSTPFGNVLSAPSDVAMPVEDPIQAIELISVGKWLLLEKGRIDDQEGSLRIDAVGNFVDVICSSSENWDSSPQKSGLVLPRTGTEQKESNTSNLGGVAIACDTKSEVMKLASILQLNKGGITKSFTESGIILQSSTEASATVPTAVILPFAIDSWQIATFIFGKDLYEEDSDEIE